MRKYNKGIKTIVSGSLWVFVGLFVGYLLEYANKIIIGRMFGPSGYGVISLGLSLSLIFSSLSLIGMQTGIARFLSMHSYGRDNIRLIVYSGLKIVLSLSILCSVVLMINKNFVAKYFIKEDTAESTLLIFILLIPIIAVAQYFYSCLRGLKLAKSAVISQNILRRLVVLIFLIIFIFLGIKNIFYISCAYLGGFVVYMLASGIRLKRNIVYSLQHSEYTAFMTKDLILFSLPLLFSFILKNFGGQVSNIFIGYFKNTREVGFFSAALPFSKLISLPLTGVLFMFLPVVSEFWKYGNKDIIKSLYKTVSKLLFCASGLICLILIIFSKIIIAKSFGKEFLPAHVALIYISLGQFINVICGPAGALLLAAGDSKRYFIGDLITMLFTFLLYIIFIPKYGFLAAAFITMLRLITLNIFYLIFVRKLIKVSPFSKQMFYAVIFIVGLSFLLNEIIADKFWVIKLVLITLAYFGIIIKTRVLEKESIVWVFKKLKSSVREEE